MSSVIITGASSGIGKASVARFARAGWTVIVTVRDLEHPTAGEPLPEGVFVERLDLADPASVVAFAERVLSAHGAPDVLVNNAGTLQFGSIEDASAKSIEQVFRVNVFSQIELIKAFIPGMRKRGSGLIVNVTSLGGRLVFPFFGVYNASKHALEGFSEGLWHELKPFGIRVKAVEPGFVETPIYNKAMRDSGGDVVYGTPPYQRYEEAMVDFEHAITNRTTPEQAAEEIWRVVNDPSDRLRYPIAAYARPLLAARRFFGDMAFMRFMHSRWMGK